MSLAHIKHPLSCMTYISCITNLNRFFTNKEQKYFIRLLRNLQINSCRENVFLNQIRWKWTRLTLENCQVIQKVNLMCDRGSVSENDKSNISKIIYSNILLKHVCIDF